MSLPGGPSASSGRPAKFRKAWWLAVAVVAALATVSAVAWLVMPGKSHDSASPGPAVTGKAVEQVLLGGAELTAMLDQPFKSTTDSPIYGGLQDMDEPATPGECEGVMNVAPRHSYRSADVQSYARETWADATPTVGPTRPSTKVMFVAESVVALPSAAAAKALFADFAEQWKRCDGQAVNSAPGTADAKATPHLPGTEIHITDVRVTDTVLAASIALDSKPGAPDARAVGVQGNCIVGVLIAFTGAQHGTGSGNPETSSIDAVHTMMDKVAKLS